MSSLDEQIPSAAELREQCRALYLEVHAMFEEVLEEEARSFGGLSESQTERPTLTLIQGGRDDA